MDKKTLYEKAEKAINQAFELAKQSAKTVSEKAGEAAHVTKLLIEKATLEHKVSGKFAQLGNRVYEMVVRESKRVDLAESGINSLIEETKKLDVELSQVEAALDRARGEKKRDKKHSRKGRKVS